MTRANRLTPTIRPTGASGLGRLTIAVVVGGLATFAGLAIAARMLYDQTEDRLLRQQTQEAIAVLGVSLAQVRAPLDAAAETAAATNGDAETFSEYMTRVIEGQAFSSAALFRIGDPTPLAQVGAPMSLPLTGDPSATQIVSTATQEPFEVVDLLKSSAGRRIGYAVVDAGDRPRFVVYGERTLSADPNVRRRTDQPFAQLEYAIYFGSSPDNDRLLGASVRDLPLQGRTASGTTPFGQTELLLVMHPIGHLSSDLFAALWWIIASIGTAMTFTVAALTDRLGRRRDQAVQLAAENERLYTDQRQIAETLQLSLLPDHLDVPPDVTLAARYWPAGAANLIGGDFYDVFAVDERRWGITIGDVCGKGIQAAALTGVARHTIRAVAAGTASPSEVLRAVHLAFAAVLPPTYCSAAFLFLEHADDGTCTLRLALGGHPQPYLCRADGTVEAVGEHGTILGMIEPSMHDTITPFGPGDTLMLYTDGLTDAPASEAVPLGEITETLASSQHLHVEETADAMRKLKRRRRPHGSGDDTAIIVMRKMV